MVSQLHTRLASMHVSFQHNKLYNRFFTNKAPIHNNFAVLYVSSLFHKVVLVLICWSLCPGVFCARIRQWVLEPCHYHQNFRVINCYIGGFLLNLYVPQRPKAGEIKPFTTFEINRSTYDINLCWFYFSSSSKISCYIVFG